MFGRKRPTVTKELWNFYCSAPYDSGESYSLERLSERNIFESFAHEYINPPFKMYEDLWATQLLNHGDAINDRLRGGYADQEDLEKNQHIAEHKAKSDFMIYNGTRKPLFERMILDGKENGCDLFASWHLYGSLRKGRQTHGDDIVELNIFIPRGTPCAFLDDAGYEGRLAVVLQRDLKLSVVHREIVEKRIIFTCRVISSPDFEKTPV